MEVLAFRRDLYRVDSTMEHLGIVYWWKKVPDGVDDDQSLSAPFLTD